MNTGGGRFPRWTGSGHEGEDLVLSGAQEGQRIGTAPGGDQLLHQGGVHDRAALVDPVECLDELVHDGDPALEEVSDLAAAGQQLQGALDLHVGGQDQDAGGGTLLGSRAALSPSVEWDGGILMSMIAGSGRSSATSSRSRAASPACPITP
ncbi:hypothetical protein [Streptomyces albiflavescens]|uniref:hypothetical protein n=1 Tax=Streptomyces albiflavescens TaxID=1623582 RepID=UPI001E3AF11C|nr:hypothetical protein [Streptomyces albiflavescens]